MISSIKTNKSIHKCNRSDDDDNDEINEKSKEIKMLKKQREYL